MELVLDIVNDEVAAVPRLCQICNEPVFLHSFLPRVRYVLVSVVCSMGEGRIIKLRKTFWRENFR